eukprot:Hpha_TRINITY_DN16189_c4_g1::TRINITY_DN16189_c4_g1_i3::g.5330::m.5330
MGRMRIEARSCNRGAVRIAAGAALLCTWVFYVLGVLWTSQLNDPVGYTRHPWVRECHSGDDGLQVTVSPNGMTPLLHTPLGDAISTLWLGRARDGLIKGDIHKLGAGGGSVVEDDGKVWLIVLNTGRGTKRQTKVMRDASLTAPFDGVGFNFHKAKREEVLFGFDVQSNPMQEQSWGCGQQRHFVMLNPAPLGIDSGLLCPFVHENRSQRGDFADAVEVALLFASLVPAGLRVGFNSLAAGASVNHLHWQFWRPPLPPNGRLPIESAPTRPLQGLTKTLGAEGAAVHTPRWEELLGYQMRAVALRGALQPHNRPVAAELLANCTRGLLSLGVAHNMLYSRVSHGTVYVIPRRGVSDETWFRHKISPGFPEVSGEMIMSSPDLVSNLTAAELNHHFGTYLSLAEDEFREAVRACTTPGT